MTTGESRGASQAEQKGLTDMGILPTNTQLEITDVFALAALLDEHLGAGEPHTGVMVGDATAEIELDYRADGGSETVRITEHCVHRDYKTKGIHSYGVSRDQAGNRTSLFPSSYTPIDKKMAISMKFDSGQPAVLKIANYGSAQTVHTAQDTTHLFRMVPAEHVPAPDYSATVASRPSGLISRLRRGRQ